MGNRSYAKAFISRVKPGEVAERNRYFQSQVRDFNLHYDCRNCVHLNDQNNQCSLEYPNDELWQAAEQGWALTHGGDLVFCKYYEVS